MIFWLNCKLREEKLLGWWLPGNETPIIKKRFARWLSINKQSLLYFDLSSLRPGRCSEEQEAAKRQLSVNVVAGNQRRCRPRTSYKRRRLPRTSYKRRSLPRTSYQRSCSSPPEPSSSTDLTWQGNWRRCLTLIRCQPDVKISTTDYNNC